MKAVDTVTTQDTAAKDPVSEAIRVMAEGGMVVLIDDADRENEGDLVVAADKVTPEILSFMFSFGRGLVCLALPEERLQALGLPRQVAENSSPLGTNFAVSFDHKSAAGSGVTAAGRAKTILESVKPEVSASEFVRPGFVFPLGAVPGGVLRRRGQTEGSVDLARLAGCFPAGVICEIMDDDGTMLRGEALNKYCETHKLPLVSIAELVQYRIDRETSVRRVAELELTESSMFSRTEELSALVSQAGHRAKLYVYTDDVDGREHFAIVCGTPGKDALVRVHSECLTGDIFGSRRCDCGFQLTESLKRIFESGTGALVYLHQEGRGIGLSNKLRAYELQDKGFDTVEANVKLGFSIDDRSYRTAARILSDLALTSIRLMTNNPEKITSLSRYGIQIAERVSILAPVDEYNRSYLETKRSKLGHLN